MGPLCDIILPSSEARDRPIVPVGEFVPASPLLKSEEEVLPMYPETGVSFRCEDSSLQRVYDEAERRCLGNLQNFAGRTVLVEGGGYQKIWLETQPMGGEMYALRNLEAAMNNTLLFMEHQRADGRLPGSVKLEEGRLIPEYNKYQGFCFPFPALNLYYLSGEDPAYLDALRETLARFDACLRRTRALKPDGLLRSFCVYDTGEDNALRYGDAPCWWTEDAPPEGYQVVPMASMDVTSWSYACRDTLRQISLIQGKPEEAARWEALAAEVADALRRELWDEAAGTLFDRDRLGRSVRVLSHSPLRCMYWGSLSREAADRFVREHLLNPEEFWTPFPLPSTAVNDPSFRNAPENNWSGQPEGLTWQRAILALENYGYEPLVSRLGDILLRNLARCGCRFTQQYDPFTGEPSLPPAAGDPEVLSSYGPTLLAALEYIAHRWGIHPHLNEIWFSLGSGVPCEYEAVFRGIRARIRSDGRRAEASLNGRVLFQGACGVRVVTDLRGNLLRTVPLEAERPL